MFMEYEVIRDITEEQYTRIKEEQHRLFNKDNICIVRANGIDIGFAVSFFICGRLTIEYYLFNEFQHKGYGILFVNIVTDYISSLNPTFDVIYLLIYHTNIPSIKVALQNGYVSNCADWEFNDIIYDEMPEYYIYSKSNPYYKVNHCKFKKVPKDIY